METQSLQDLRQTKNHIALVTLATKLIAHGDGKCNTGNEDGLDHFTLGLKDNQGQQGKVYLTNDSKRIFEPTVEMFHVLSAKRHNPNGMPFRLHCVNFEQVTPNAGAQAWWSVLAIKHKTVEEMETAAEEALKLDADFEIVTFPEIMQWIKDNPGTIATKALQTINAMKDARLNEGKVAPWRRDSLEKAFDLDRTSIIYRSSTLEDAKSVWVNKPREQRPNTRGGRQTQSTSGIGGLGQRGYEME